MKIAGLYTFEGRPRKQQTGTRKVRGVGVNDADYQTIDNNGNRCPAYIKWKDILSRVYAPSMVVIQFGKTSRGMGILLSTQRVVYGPDRGAAMGGRQRPAGNRAQNILARNVHTTAARAEQFLNKHRRKHDGMHAVAWQVPSTMWKPYNRLGGFTTNG